MIGDALGAPWEGADARRIAAICAAYPTLPAAEQEMHRAVFGLLLNPQTRHAHYTDDTQMTLALAETLCEWGSAAEDDRTTQFEEALARAFAEFFDPMRGYGPGAHRVLADLRGGARWDEPAGRLFGGKGSFGNGAAMRAAPVGLYFHDRDTAVLRLVARRSSLPTHIHPLGIAGAVMQANAVACACRWQSEPFDAGAFLADVEAGLGDDEAGAAYRAACGRIGELLPLRPSPATIADVLGDEITALESVPTALYAFLAHPDDFRAAVTFAVQVGGDADTISAMCGAISGAYLGASALPSEWLDALENGWQGRDDAQDLADRLYSAWTR